MPNFQTTGFARVLHGHTSLENTRMTPLILIRVSLADSVEQSGWRRLPHTGVPEIVSRLQPDCSTEGVRKLLGNNTAVHSCV